MGSEKAPTDEGSGEEETTKKQKNKKVATKVRVTQHNHPTSLTDGRQGVEPETSTMKEKSGAMKKDQVATSNLQRCKIQVDGRGQIQHLRRAIEEHKWDVILLSEISSRGWCTWW